MHISLRRQDAEATATQKGTLVPARVTDLKVILAPADSATGVGAARAFATIKALVRFCRAIGTIQEVELQPAELDAYKPVVIKNTYLVDYVM